MAVGQALVVMVSTAVEDMQIANAIVTAWLALMLFFGGFFITLRDVRTHSTRSNYRQLHALSLLASSTAQTTAAFVDVVADVHMLRRFPTGGSGSITCRSSSGLSKE